MRTFNSWDDIYNYAERHCSKILEAGGEFPEFLYVSPDVQNIMDRKLIVKQRNNYTSPSSSPSVSTGHIVSKINLWNGCVTVKVVTYLGEDVCTFNKDEYDIIFNNTISKMINGEEI